MATLTIKRNDLARQIEDALKLDGAAIDLTGASVSIVLRNRTTETVIKRAATILSPATAGLVEYQFVSGDTVVAGSYDLEWEIVFPDTRHLTVPDNSYHTLNILADLG